MTGDHSRHCGSGPWLCAGTGSGQVSCGGTLDGRGRSRCGRGATGSCATAAAAARPAAQPLQVDGDLDASRCAEAAVAALKAALPLQTRVPVRIPAPATHRALSEQAGAEAAYVMLLLKLSATKSSLLL